MSSSRGEGSVSGSISRLFFSADQQHDAASLSFQLDHQIGSFLSNSHPYNYNSTIFCPHYEYRKTYRSNNPIAVDSLTEGLHKILENYYWSSYNNHWYYHCYPSPSMFMLIRDLGSDLDFKSDFFKNAAQSTKGSKIRSHNSYLETPYFKEAKPFAGQWNNAQAEHVEDYYKLLEALEIHSTYWTDLTSSKIINAVVPDTLSYLLHGMIYLQPKKRDEFISKVSKPMEKALR